MIENYEISNVELQDCARINELATENHGSERLDFEFIQHWYFQNPTQMFTFVKVIRDGAIEGYASTNNFIYNIDSENVKVAMPQNVLTSFKIRGKGLFSKLYFKTEEENRSRYSIDTFLTFTNEMSTPIFLNKFGYKYGVCPDLLFYPFNPFCFFFKKNWEIKKHLTPDLFPKEKGKIMFSNAMVKSLSQLLWRYNKYSEEEISVLMVEKGDEKGIAILKTEKKKGVKILLLMDVVITSYSVLNRLLVSCITYSCTHFFAGFLMFDPGCKLDVPFLFKIRKKNYFNFLVKGKDEEATNRLSQTEFKMFLGDLDFF